MLWLSRNFKEAYNYVNGLDWNFKFWKNWYFQGELFLSNTKEINDSSLFKSTYQTYNGMIPEVIERTTNMKHTCTFLPNKKIIQTISLYDVSSIIYNYDGVFKELLIQLGFQIYMIGLTRFNLSYLAFNRERFRNVLFSGINRLEFNISSTPIKGVSFSVNGEGGKFIYLDLRKVE